jgi:hypothetical protein
MDIDNQQTICPVCNEPRIEDARDLQSWPITRYKCSRCGTFDMDRALAVQTTKPWADVAHFVSAWVRRENKAGITPNIGKGIRREDISNPEWWKTKYRNVGFPATTNEKLDALLLTYAESVSNKYQERVKTDRPELISTVAAKNIDEIKGLTNLLEEMGRLIKVEKAYGALTISAQGWLRIDELRKDDTTSNTTFIAMWFSESTKEYREAVITAVEFCGYRPVIVDQEEYSGFIMDQVITLIQQAKFVIADFTCLPETIEDGKVKNGVRGGVYWESGMAYGLGKPLIHTCKNTAESKDRIHFDVDQYNTIYWQEDDLGLNIRPLEETNINPTFAEKLAARILALVGKGSYMPE